MSSWGISVASIHHTILSCQMRPVHAHTAHVNYHCYGYGSIERGTTEITLHRLEQLAEIFGISLAELLNIDGKFVFNQIGENCNNNGFNLDSKPLTESEYKYQLEKQQLIIESLQQEVTYLKEIIKLLRHGD